MSTLATDIWTVTASSAYTTSIREDLDGRLGLSIDYVATIDGAWTMQAGELAYQVDQRAAEAFGAMLLATAPRAVVIARAEDRGLTPRVATKSTMEIEVATGTGAILTVGAVLRVRSGTVQYVDAAAGGITIPLESSTWTVIENENDGEFVEVGDVVIVECDTAGRVSAANTLTFSPQAPIAGISTLTSDGTTMRTTGRDAESLPELRLRVGAARAAPGGSPGGLVSAVRELPWVVAVGLGVASAGYSRIVVAPAPPTLDDAEALGDAIYAAKALGTVTLGDESVGVTGADGRVVTVFYDVGTTENVTVVFSVTPDETVTQADANRIARSAINDVFARLNPGDTLRYLRVIGALNLPGIVSATVTLNGSTNDVLPTTAADILVPVFA